MPEPNPPTTPISSSSEEPFSTTAATTTDFPTAELYCHYLYNISNASTIARLTFPNATREQFVGLCLRGVSNKVSVFVAVLIAVIFLLSVLGNSLVILTLVRHKKMRTVTNVYLLNLAVSDLLLAVFCMPFTLIPMMMQAFIFGSLMCVMIRYLQAVSVTVSCFTLVAISIERFYAICQPLRSRRWQTTAHSFRVLVVIWMASFVLMVPVAVFNKVIMVNKQTPACREIWPDRVLDAIFAVVLDVVLFAMPSVIMAVSYAMVARRLWSNTDLPLTATSESGDHSARKDSPGDGQTPEVTTPVIPRRRDVKNDHQKEGKNNQTKKRKHKHQSNGQSNHSKARAQTSQHQNNVESFDNDGTAASTAMLALRPAYYHRVLASKRRVVKMLFVVVLEYFVCWGPLYTLNTWVVLDYENVQMYVTPTHRAAIFLLAYLSSCIHPITYCFMNKRFKQSFTDAFRCCFARRGASLRLHSEVSQGVRLGLCVNSTARSNCPDSRGIQS